MTLVSITQMQLIVYNRLEYSKNDIQMFAISGQ